MRLALHAPCPAAAVAPYRLLDTVGSCLQSCMATGNAKVQWMACASAHVLFSQPQLQALQEARAPTSSLLLLLTMLVRDCANFKVRTAAGGRRCGAVRCGPARPHSAVPRTAPPRLACRLR